MKPQGTPMDIYSVKQRSALMAKIRRANTRPEILVRSLLHRLGHRFRVHRKDLPGTPDIVLPGFRIAIFVHGCFWHQHARCRRATMPATNVFFWKAKFDSNKIRDRRKVRELRRIGWKVIVLWECETKRTGLERLVVNRIAAR
ncbi:MAG TPA: DNA mismatch endonuclease Vsr [Phycisphaerae bacterium]|nr:DNA mismatch endonuclease Vsr [Phycisphaerae bacterium]